MDLGRIDLGPATVVLCVGTALLLATRLVEIFAHRRAMRRTREIVDASRRAARAGSKKA